jgi:hypothetical protein
MTKTVYSTKTIGVITLLLGFGSGKSIIALKIHLNELKHNLKREEEYQLTSLRQPS